MASQFGYPLDILSTPYGLSGQFSPETALQEQALNRKRLIANLLVQQGLQQPQGQMAGRFYVAPSPLQHVANLGSMLAGVATGNYIDNKQADLAQKDTAAYQAAIQAYKDKILPKKQTRNMLIDATRAEMPDTFDINDLQGGVTTRMLQPPAEPNGVLPPAIPERERNGMLPTTQTIPVTETIQPDPAEARAALIDLQAHQHPLVQRFAALELQRLQHEQDATRAQSNADREYDLRKGGQTFEQGFAEKKLAQDADLRNLMVQSQEAQKAETLRNTMAMKEMQLAQMERDSLRDAKSQERADALRAEIAKGNQEIQRMNAQTQRMNADSQRLRLDPRTRPMSPTAQKELIQTEEELQGSHQAIQHLQNALAINNAAMGFTGAGALASAGSLLPEALRPKAVDATVDLDNLITGSALPQLKAIFGGMPTEGERKVLLELQGSSSKTPGQRKLIFERAIQAANNRIKFNQQKAQQLRSGQYFAGDGGLDTTAAPNPGMPTATSSQPRGTTGEVTRRKYNPATGKIE